MMTNPPPSLDHVDPVEAWKPWQPRLEQPWNLRWAGHLYRRAGFGASLKDLQESVRRGPESTLDRLLHEQPTALSQVRTLTALGEQIAKQDDLPDLRGWWMYLILNSPCPLREKLTLFWHNHFATSIAKVARTELMFGQNRTLRRDALGKFRVLLSDISRDPGMLIWLDSNSNLKGRANENYARELMELFTLGVGHYTEKDVREAARAFTGWQNDDDHFEFSAAFHDDGQKTVLGKTGKWNGDDVLRIILKQPAAAHHLIGKLYRHFISEVAVPPMRLLKPLIERFRKTDFDIADLMETMLRSHHFFSAYAYRQRVKSPVEFIAGAVHDLVKMDQAELRPALLALQVCAIGQLLFEPPTVKGWAGGRSWLNSATILARNNFAEMVALGDYPAVIESPPGQTDIGPSTLVVANDEKDEKIEPLASHDPIVLFEEEKAHTPKKAVDLLADLLFQGDLSPKARGRLIAFLAEGSPRGKLWKRRLREAIHAAMTMPEYQLA
jgi:uncharacterized protein (DUF1800 family)